MTDIVEAANIIQQEETDFRSPDSENLKTRMGASINYALRRNSQKLVMDGTGIHVDGRRGDEWQPHHLIRRKSVINTYCLTNGVNGSAGAITINAKIYDENDIELGNLFSTAPSIDSAIDSAGATGPYIVGRYVEAGQDIRTPNPSKVVGSLAFTELQEGYSLRFFIEGIQTDGAGFLFELWLREVA